MPAISNKSSESIEIILKPLLTLMKRFALMPAEKRFSPAHIICAVSLITVLLYYEYWLLYEKIIRTDKFLIASSMLRIINTTLMTVLNVSAIIYANLSRRMHKIMKRFDDAEESLRSLCKSVKEDIFKTINNYLMSITFVIISSITYGTYMFCKTLSSSAFKTYTCLSIHQCLITLITLKIYSFTKIINDMFSALNNALQDGGNFRKERLRKLSRLHHNLCNLIDMVNRSFGYEIAGIYGVIALYITQAVNILIQYAEMKGTSNLFVVVHIVVTAIILLALGKLIASSCEDVLNNANQTLDICYKLLAKYSVTIKLIPRELTLHQELVLLIYQVTHCKPKFTAADFFTVHHKMLYKMCLCIITYVIITSQLQ